MRTVFLIVIVLSLALPAGGVFAGSAAAELALDRSAVSELIGLALPEPAAVDLPGPGRWTLGFESPRTVSFVDEGVEAVIGLRVAELDWVARLDVRYVPQVERLTGVVRLVPISVVPQLPLPLDVDLAPWIDAVELPRRLDWELDLARDRRVRLTCFVQAVRIDDDRLTIELALVTPGHPGPSAVSAPVPLDPFSVRIGDSVRPGGAAPVDTTPAPGS